MRTHRESDFAERDALPSDADSIQLEPVGNVQGDLSHFLAIPLPPVQLLNLAP